MLDALQSLAGTLLVSVTLYTLYSVWSKEEYSHDAAANWISWAATYTFLYQLGLGLHNTFSAFTSLSAFSESPLLSGILATAFVWLLASFAAASVSFFLVPVHERCHQAVARFFGVDGRIECEPGWLPRTYNRGRFFTRPAHKLGKLEVWQDRLVCAAPLVIGVAQLSVAWFLVHVVFDLAFVWGATSASILTASLSGSDWASVLRVPWRSRSFVPTDPPPSHLAAEGIPR